MLHLFRRACHHILLHLKITVIPVNRTLFFFHNCLFCLMMSWTVVIHHKYDCIFVIKNNLTWKNIILLQLIRFQQPCNAWVEPHLIMNASCFVLDGLNYLSNFPKESILTVKCFSFIWWVFTWPFNDYLKCICS